MYTYYTVFNLTNPVLDIDKANNYLHENNMTNFLINDVKSNPDNKIISNLTSKIEHIQWNLIKDDFGNIIVKTNQKLSNKEALFISDWITGQNADGLGEGFEQQDFAWYIDDDCPEEGSTIMASFDWQTNDYCLILEE